jgi:ketosteroid isomerase-like protein
MSMGLGSGEAILVFESFVAAINRRDPDALFSLMTADHLFIDSLGNRVLGAETMRSGWRGYFTMCPDYKITAVEVLAGRGVVLATGTASGTIANTAWHTPAAWQATIRDGKIAEWRVFADNKPVYEILARTANFSTDSDS